MGVSQWGCGCATRIIVPSLCTTHTHIHTHTFNARNMVFTRPDFLFDVLSKLAEKGRTVSASFNDIPFLDIPDTCICCLTGDLYSDPLSCFAPHVCSCSLDQWPPPPLRACRGLWFAWISMASTLRIPRNTAELSNCGNFIAIRHDKPCTGLASTWS